MIVNPPIEIKVHVEQKEVAFIWENQHIQILTHQHLRESCQCAFCKTKRFTQQAVNQDTEISITAIYDQGYGVQICFSDGHDKGIFPWQYLKQL